MTIRYKCEECGAALNIKDELAGTKGTCPRCQVEFVVPAPEGVVEEKAASVAAKPAAPRAERRPGEALSDDDIGEFLAGGPAEPRNSRHAAVDDDTDSDDLDDEKGRGKRSSKVEDEGPDEDTDFGEEDVEDRPKKKKRAGKSPVKSDSAESAAIAKNLMARGDKAPPREEKKGGRPFGGAEGAREGDKGEFGAGEIVGYFFRQSWKYLLGGVAFMALCYWISSSMFKGVELPPLAYVTGTVLLDGAPLPKAMVQFVPVLEATASANLRLGPSFGFTDEKGKFILQYAVIDGKEYPGAVIGKHQVLIKVNGEDGKEQLPPEYSSPFDSTLKQEVAKGMAPIEFKLSSKATAAPSQ